ncbi:hypothetical protein YUBABA_01970 [Serratia phage vB_SmaM-Yubaba]|nr:hypothetical protein SUREIYA_00380 [Serratia phage vB_SmaM-Sureiya]UQT03399.1 hypothetical protein YUBABA_01970 [Serratia phage vB_SmaM-Yubaba]
MRTLESFRDELCELTAHALDNLVIQNKPEFQTVQKHNGGGPDNHAPTEVTFTREGPLEIITIPFYGKEVKLRFKFGYPRDTIPQGVLDRFKDNRDNNVKNIAIMFNHVIHEVFETQPK